MSTLYNIVVLPFYQNDNIKLYYMILHDNTYHVNTLLHTTSDETNKTYKKKCHGNFKYRLWHLPFNCSLNVLPFHRLIFLHSFWPLKYLFLL